MKYNYSIYPPFWWTTRRRRGMTWSQVARTVSPSISFHDLINFRLRALILECDWEHWQYPKVHRIKIWGRWRPELLWPEELEIVGRNRWWNSPCHLWSSHTSSPPCCPPKEWIYWVNCVSSDIQYIKHYLTLSHFNYPYRFF